VRHRSIDWKVYRTRFLIRAKQLSEPYAFIDALGREHHGRPGDYLVESSDGQRSIQRREIFEDVYVAMCPAEVFSADSPSGLSAFRRRASTRSSATA